MAYVIAIFCLKLLLLRIPENKLLMALTRCEPDPLLASASSSASSTTSPMLTGEADEEEDVLDDEDGAAEERCLGFVSALSDLYDRELVATIGWAKQIPG